MNQHLFDFIRQNYNSKAPTPRIIQSGQGAYFTVDGKKLLNMCSSHYLGFAMDERLKKAAVDAIEKWGIGTGYRTLAGTNSLNTELEDRLAAFKGTDAAIVLPSGYLANSAAIQTIIGKDDIVISDELNHASIIDAVKLSGVKNKYIYRHGDMKHLEEILKQIQHDKLDPGSLKKSLSDRSGIVNSKKILIVTDGVFSMDGDLAPLPEIVKLAQMHGAITMVDDAHGEGVMGPGGRGTIAHFRLEGKVDIEVGTLSKAFSVVGGFIAGSSELINFYKQKARQFMFTSALTAPDTAALLEAVKIMQESDDRVKKLWVNTHLLKDSLKKAGFDIGHSESPITPVMLGDEDIARQFAAALFDAGVYASAICFPMVSKGAARIRLIPSAAHSKKDIEFAVEKIIETGKKITL